LKKLATVDLYAGWTGTVVRNVIACPRPPECSYAKINTKGAGKEDSREV